MRRSARLTSSVLGTLVLVLSIAGCNNALIGTDLGLVEPGCRTPEACYKTGIDCPCARTDVEGQCKVCDPRAKSCPCEDDIGTAEECTEGAKVCVGRAPTTCPGVGARCIPVNTSCSVAVGVPPDQVGTSIGGALEPRCTYVDDFCCPGTAVADMSGPDLGGADLSASVDMSTVD